MALHVSTKGLDLPIAGAPAQALESGPSPKRIAIMADDYIGMKPAFQVQVGDAVQCGQVLFEDKKTPGVRITSPGAGTIVALNRGERRAFQSLVVELDQSAPNASVDFAAYTGKDIADYGREGVQALLVESGLWTALRTRPFSKVPGLDTVPYAIFVTAMDTNPLAANVDLAADGRQEDLDAGMVAISALTDGNVHFCKAPKSQVHPTGDASTHVEEFQGPHPAGDAGYHIHTLAPVGHHRTCWYVGVQDLLAIGQLFRAGTLDVERVISFAGPAATKPRHLKVRQGVSLGELSDGEVAEGELRIISGSVLSGRKSMGEVHGFLGRYHTQVSVIKEDHERVFLGWLDPGLEKFSIVGAFLSRFIPDKKFAMTTSTHGGARAMVPLGGYERVMPFDILPTFLLRSLAVDDLERSEELGCLELDEEDLALCTFVCPSKYEFGPILRRNLNTIEKEG
jgi:Na+-transporting NADH:ubiquinone oxidoreductase subunit A